MTAETRGAPTPFAPAAAGTVTVYRGATVIDGTGSAPRPATTVVVDGERIVAVAPDAAAAVPVDAEVVDLAGHWLIPGLIDSHQHVATPPNRPVAEAVLRRDLLGGVTATRDMADDLRQVADLARASLVGEIAAPDLHYAALMAGPSFFDDPRTWQVSQGSSRAASRGCRRSRRTPTCRWPSRWPGAPSPPRSRSTRTCPARPSPRSPPRRTARASPSGRTRRSSRPRPVRSSPPGWTASPTSRCSSTRRRGGVDELSGQAAHRLRPLHRGR
ncbi:hypothetical protein ACFQZC_03900 [Streptacidiphilus monticola]